MLILAHRGYWHNKQEQNNVLAFKRAFDLNFGIETDLRDYNSKIVIAHDMPTGTELLFEDLLDILAERNLPLALNIKADGLGREILNILTKYNHTNYFTFDMSIPELIKQLNNKLFAFTSLSDIHQHSPLLEKCSGIWLDAFNSDWYTEDLLNLIMKKPKKLCLVSGELHNRDVTYQWNIIKKCKYLCSENLMLCTDYPEKAKEFFYD